MMDPAPLPAAIPRTVLEKRYMWGRTQLIGAELACAIARVAMDAARMRS